MNEPTTADPLWTALPPRQRRVLGVLVEKAKTTPNAYPLTLNGIVTGCNQKSNRFPTMTLDADDVEDALEALREAKAVAEVHGDGRTVKYRHYVKDWMGVDGTELAVIAELLLRGAQTIGELRGRAARMAKGRIGSMSELRPILDNLMRKKLVIPLTAAGRGQIVTHGLYSDSELQRLRNEHGGGQVIPGPSGPPAHSSSPVPEYWDDPVADTLPTDASSTDASSTDAPPADTPTASPAGSLDRDATASLAELRAELTELKSEVAKLRNEVEDIWTNLR